MAMGVYYEISGFLSNVLAICIKSFLPGALAKNLGGMEFRMELVGKMTDNVSILVLIMSFALHWIPLDRS